MLYFIRSGIIRTSNYIYMCWILFIYKGSTSSIESINQSGSSKKNICWYETKKLPKNLNIYLRNYQRGTAIFLATKHKKTIMVCSYLNFSIQKIHQNSKKWWLSWGIDLWKWLWGCFSQFLLLYGANASEAVQKISTTTLLELCQLTKTANFKATFMKKLI